MDNKIITLLLSLLGFLNALYLYYQHQREVATGQKMFCLIGGDCGQVVGSKYGTIFGIKNEKIGMAFYLLVGIYSAISFFLPGFISDFWMWIKIIIGVATVLSLYLLYIQTFVLKKLCSWCLVAIAINILIFYFHSTV